MGSCALKKACRPSGIVFAIFIGGSLARTCLIRESSFGVSVGGATLDGGAVLVGLAGGAGGAALVGGAALLSSLHGALAFDGLNALEAAESEALALSDGVTGSLALVGLTACRSGSDGGAYLEYLCGISPASRRTSAADLGADLGADLACGGA